MNDDADREQGPGGGRADTEPGAPTTNDPGERRGTTETVLKAASSAAGMAAIAVGALYATGAIVRTAELRDADLTVRDVFPLIPLEQHLSRGIQVVVDPVAFVVVALFFVVGLYLRWAPERERKPESEPPKWQLIAAISALALVLIAGLLYRPLTMAELVIAMASAALVVGLGIRRDRTVGPLTVTAALAVAVAALSIFSAQIAPQPLPRVTLVPPKKKPHKRCLEGQLIAVTDATWYIRIAPDQFSAVPVDSVAASRVLSRDRTPEDDPREKTLLQLFKGDAADDPQPRSKRAASKSPAAATPFGIKCP